VSVVPVAGVATVMAGARVVLPLATRLIDRD
jgi:hypothetical protein